MTLRTLLISFVLMASARATPITFTGTGTNTLGNAIAASASFDTSVAGHLSVTLTNLDTQVIHVGGADVLTGLYFNLGTSATLTTVSATLGPDSVIVPNSTSTAGIQTNWAYFNSPSYVNGAPTGDRAIAATGLIAGTNYDFTGTYHGSSGYLAGPAYGIVGNPNDWCNGVGITPLEAPSLTFSFTYTGTISDINNVAFVYGTKAGEGSITGHVVTVPVPDGGSTLVLLGAALVGSCLFRRRRK